MIFWELTAELHPAQDKKYEDSDEDDGDSSANYNSHHLYRNKTGRNQEQVCFSVRYVCMSDRRSHEAEAGQHSKQIWIWNNANIYLI